MEPPVKIVTVQQRMGRLVAAHRKKEGLTQQALAERINVSGPTLSHIENGKGALLTLYLKIFKYFGFLGDLDGFFDTQMKRLESERSFMDLDCHR